MRKLLAVVVLVAALFAVAVTGALATGGGQPGLTCPSTPISSPLAPGNAGTAPGSAFNEVSGTAGPLYAGNGANQNTPANTAAVSQYDVACFKHQ
jgi:hypothetical protein